MSTIQMESLVLMVTEILPIFKKGIPTDRPTDRVRYRAAEAAKNNIYVYNIQMKSLSFTVCETLATKKHF